MFSRKDSQFEYPAGIDEDLPGQSVYVHRVPEMGITFIELWHCNVIPMRNELMVAGIVHGSISFGQLPDRAFDSVLCQTRRLSVVSSPVETTAEGIGPVSEPIMLSVYWFNRLNRSDRVSNRGHGRVFSHFGLTVIVAVAGTIEGVAGKRKEVNGTHYADEGGCDVASSFIMAVAF
ncbi:hypothetical protein F3Y22_tig00011718pilonHSYRG00163 [Hibiscus syriacus]|uniref:Uncharacterized protein n=1 Tax=Hibiscus syriacus TaxID=106335 RepID=A0A6A3C4D3_HIBSY|nr:hypothetical protein F3Y22_tig00011718pilonHSYRG00163 [Hibiscus syriacus]